MRDIEKQAVHVCISPAEAVECKRDLLEMQLHLLNILKALISMRDLRKSAFRLKSETKIKMRETVKEVNKILAGLPVSEELLQKGLKRKELFEIKPAIKRAKEIKEKIKIDAELREIKKQLEKL